MCKQKKYWLTIPCCSHISEMKIQSGSVNMKDMIGHLVFDDETAANNFLDGLKEYIEKNYNGDFKWLVISENMKPMKDIMEEELPDVHFFQDCTKKWTEINIECAPSIINNYIRNLKVRLGDNEYAQSIKVYKDPANNDFVLAGFDVRSNEKTNYALIKGTTIYCWAGNANGDGHNNEFLNNPDGFIPNAFYKIENAVYQTDTLGRVIGTYEHHVTHRETNRKESRPNYTNILNAMGKRDNDVAGHIVAHCIDGASEAINIVPMDKSFNNSQEWKAMESLLKFAYDNNIESYVHRHIEYNNDTRIPSSITVYFEISVKDLKFDLS